ncbi:uncharacterized protein B0T15DRAFT_529024 [Chaetomium strumarium]|uniref:Uncharacterized protein n=1 Tax=Chaetomium strumarium TaxID=1170767 RepID=A0AAJ0GVQ5_9PEZI|nr:hypothetical protein B0T15DRAFT_529024 [Chaetomium strumarium]
MLTRVLPCVRCSALRRVFKSPTSSSVRHLFRPSTQRNIAIASGWPNSNLRYFASGRMALRNTTVSFTQRFFETFVWRPGIGLAIGLAESVLPENVQNCVLGTFLPEKRGSNTNHHTEESSKAARMQTVREADTTERNAGAMASEQVEAEADVKTEAGAEADRCMLDNAYARAKFYVSMVSYMATGMGVASQASGINWRAGSQGLDLILNSGREQVGSQYAGHDHDPEFERWTYITGVQHLLRGLPADLAPVETAILHHAMPPAMADTTTKSFAPSQPQCACRGSVNRNGVHVVIFFILGWLYSMFTRIIPEIVAFAGKAYQLEQERHYIPRLTLAASRLITSLDGAFRNLGHTAIGGALLSLFVYTAQGFMGAVTEFAEGMQMEMSGPSRGKVATAKE